MEQQEMFMVDFQNDNDADLIFVPPESEIDWLIIDLLNIYICSY